MKKGEKRRIDILSEAMDILLKEGYSKFSMRSTAKALGISLGNLQYHFPNRKILLQELLKQYLDNSINKFQKKISSTKGSLQVKIDTIVDMIISEEQDMEVCQIIYELWALSGRDEDATYALKIFYEQYFSLITDLLRYINPSLSMKESQERAVVLISLLEGMFIIGFMKNSKYPSQSDIEKELKSIINHICFK